jgi:phosphate transport system permease protein
MSGAKAFSGRARKKKTTWSVRAGDVISRFMITVGGIGTLVAVSTVFLYLLWVALPLLKPSEISSPSTLTVRKGAAPTRLTIDEYQLIGWVWRPGGHIEAFSMNRGQSLESRELAPGRQVTAAAFSMAGTEAVLGLDDGAIAVATVGFRTDFAADAAAPPAARALKTGETAEADGRVWMRLPTGQLRSQGIAFSVNEPIAEESGSPVRLVDRTESSTGEFIASYHENGEAFVSRLTRRKNILTGKTTLARTAARVPIAPISNGAAPLFIALSELADTLTLVYQDGALRRYDLRDFEKPAFMDETALLDDPGLTITACRYLLGRSTLLVGDSGGRVRAWFPVNVEQQAGDARSRTRLVAAHTFPGSGAAVTALATSQRTRIFAAGYADGSVRLQHVTSGKELGRAHPEGFNASIDALTLAPKDDGLAAVSGGQVAHWRMDPRHPEATLGALFGPVWYEGAAKPEHVWQSSSGTDDFEPKFGVMPLVFGTIKATVFSLLFGVPIALLAAIFTSEFLHPKARTVIKPLVEMMASLPSVVLGFLAALVFAPMVAGALPAILAAFVFVPAMFLAGAYLWQLAPSRLTLRARHWRLPLMFLAVPAGLLLAAASGHGIERLCFAGDIMRWLDGQIGGAAGGWTALLYPVAALLTAWAFSATVNPWLRRKSRSWSRGRCAAADAVKFLAAAALTIPAAAALGAGLAGLGLDPRGSLVGTYVQRNALVVGFVMGFAIIPIIYTLTEDALAAVPDHLRSASLGAGATPWQTAVRIVVPTAMSGIFSAVMIGLGRAVGETMIVLMAAGNTPVMEWNLFNGFRTLSANIAVELPEAVRNSTHYRTLFLAALVLFVMTFILNTIAETVRIRYRRKAVEL